MQLTVVVHEKRDAGWLNRRQSDNSEELHVVGGPCTSALKLNVCCPADVMRDPVQAQSGWFEDLAP
jgi:hypothetical protein